MKRDIAIDITFITLCSYHMPSYLSTTIVVVLSIMKKLCRMYKIIVVTMNNISCNTFFFIKFRMYILRYIIFVVKNYNVYIFYKINCYQMAICKLHCLDHVTNIFLLDIHNRPLCVGFLGNF
jgi:hypothetical protein